MIIQNEYIRLNIQTAGRRLTSVTVQDKINGRSYDLGKNIFTIQLLEARTDEACSKKEYTDTCLPLSANDLMCGELTQETLAADATARRLVERRAGQRYDSAEDGGNCDQYFLHL